VILAGDIGGTKTVLALYRPDDPIGKPLRQQKYASTQFAGLEPIVNDFLGSSPEQPRAAALGIAGPVVGRCVETTNLPWTVDAAVLESAFGIRRVDLLNDLQATALAVPFLDQRAICTLHRGYPEPDGVIAVAAPGTGLGFAFLVPTEQGHRAYPTEGGHMSLAPASELEAELLAFLKARFGHVSFERVASGSGLPNIYDFLRDTGRHTVPSWLDDALRKVADRTPVLVTAALEQRAAICEATLDLFVQLLGSAIGSAALLLMPTGGIYLGGGIPSRILGRLQQPDFLSAMHAKGRQGALLQRMPVHVMLDSEAALHGAAWQARRAEAELLAHDAAG
jgi:glucokinase